MKHFAGIVFGILFATTTLLADFGQPYGFRWVRTYNPPEGTGKVFNDLYLLQDDGLAFCGNINIDRNINAGWVLITDEAGNYVMDVTLPAIDRLARRQTVELNTIIQTDDQGFLVGGKSDAGQSSFELTKISARGEIEWRNQYATQGRSGPVCYSAIEMKEGDFIACGQGLEGMAMAVRVTAGGEVVWLRYFPGTTLYAVRELEEGLAFLLYGGLSNPNSVLLTTYGGVIVTSKRIGPGKPYAMIRTQNRGYAISGNSLREDNCGGFGLELSSQLNTNWRTHVNLGAGQGAFFQDAWGIASNYDGYMLVGGLMHDDWGALATELFFSHSGNPIWGRTADGAVGPEVERHQKNILRSVITDHDGAFIACGGTPSGCIVQMYEPVAHTPYFIHLDPPDSLVNFLVGDEVTFTAVAIDPDGDDIGYNWKINNEVIAQDTSVTMEIAEAGSFRLTCVATDGTFSDSTFWVVRARNIYISQHEPDSLSFRIRRGTPIAFNVAGRSNSDQPFIYEWRAVDPMNIEPRVVSEDSTLLYSFETVGVSYIDATIRQGEFEDNISWSILAESALARWYPSERELDVPQDTTVVFGVVPADSIALNWEVRWLFNDERIGGRREEPITFDSLGIYQMMARIEQNGMVDTIQWNITVHEPAKVESHDFIPGEFNYSLSPNPFNEVSRINLNLPTASEVSVAIYDISGRYVKQLEQRFIPAGRSSFSFNAEGLPAGVYLIRLEAGSHRAIMKAVLMR